MENYMLERRRNLWKVRHQFWGEFLVAVNNGMRPFLLGRQVPTGSKNGRGQRKLSVCYLQTACGKFPVTIQMDTVSTNISQI